MDRYGESEIDTYRRKSVDVGDDDDETDDEYVDRYLDNINKFSADDFGNYLKNNYKEEEEKLGGSLYNNTIHTTQKKYIIEDDIFDFF